MLIFVQVLGWEDFPTRNDSGFAVQYTRYGCLQGLRKDIANCVGVE